MPGSPVDPPNGGSRIPTGDPGGDLSVGSPVQNGGDPGDLVARVRELVSSGWSVRVRRRRNGSLFLAARKYINGKRREVYVAGVSEEELQRLRELGLLTTISSSRKPRQRTGSGSPRGGVGGSSHSLPTSGPPRSEGAPRPVSGPAAPGLGPGSASGNEQNLLEDDSVGTLGQKGGSCCLDSVLPAGQNGGPGPCVWGLHRLDLRFVRPWVSPLYLSSFGKVRWVERSKQHVLKLRLGKYRIVTVQVNRDGTAQVFLRASDDPLSFEEFFGFARFWLPWLFRVITGRDVSLRDFVVVAAPEINCDGRVVLLEGLKSLSLEDYYGEAVRVYTKHGAVGMPDGGTRVEVRALSWEGLGLDQLVDGMVSMVKLPVALAEIRRDLELIKGSLPRKTLEVNQLSEAVATKLANLIYLTFEKWGNRLELVLRELVGKLQEVLDPLLEEVRELRKENEELKALLRSFSAPPAGQNTSSYSALRRGQNGAAPQPTFCPENRAECGDLYKRLLELSRPSSSRRRALVKVNEREGWVSFSDDLWRYIMSRLPSGARRGLDSELLEQVRVNDGEEVEELLRVIQRRGRLSIREALEILSRGRDRGGGA